MNKKCHLYVITNQINGKRYFGITTLNPPTKRWISHKTVAKRRVRKTPLVHAMNKYGFDKFIFEIIVSDDDISYIGALEKYCIKTFKSKADENGYNLSDGGEINTGFRIPEATKKKHSERMMGKNNTFYGRTHSDESKKKISKAKTGVKMSEETKAKMRGRTSPLKGVFGESHPAFGRKRTESERKSIQLNTPHRVDVVMLNADTLEVEHRFLSKKSAGQWLIDNDKCSNKNVRSVASNISKAIQNNKKAYGYVWKEADERQSTIETAL